MGQVGRLVVERAWMVDPWTGREGLASVRVERGRIASVDWVAEDEVPAIAGGRAGSAGARGDVELDATRHGRPFPPSGLLVLPGLFDLHAHLREPGGEDAETLASGLAAAAHGGFTSVCTMANTNPAIDSPGQVARVLASAAASGSPVKPLPYAAASVGREGRTLAPFAALAAAGAIGFSDDGFPLADPTLLHNALVYSANVGLPIVEHPEDPLLGMGAEASEGLAATILGLRGAPLSAESAAVARDLEILADAAARCPPGAVPRLHLTHLSTAASIDLVRAAKARGLRVTCDVTPHHLALHDGWVGGDRRYAWETREDPWVGAAAAADPYDSATRVNPPLRDASHSAALWRGLRDGTVDAIATDHAPHRTVDKEVAFGDALPGISGIETALGLLLAAVDANVLDLMTIVRALTVGPAHVVTGSPGRGGLHEGARADLVLVDVGASWTVTSESLLSKGKNSPLMGRALPGRVLLTLAEGSVAYKAPGRMPATIEV